MVVAVNVSVPDAVRANADASPWSASCQLRGSPSWSLASRRIDQSLRVFTRIELLDVMMGADPSGCSLVIEDPPPHPMRVARVSTRLRVRERKRVSKLGLKLLRRDASLYCFWLDQKTHCFKGLR